MSLVSEALKKAQREATARQGRELGLPEPPPLQPFRSRARRRRGLVLGAAMGLAVLLVLLGAYLAQGGLRAPSPDARQSPAGQAGAAAAAAGSVARAQTSIPPAAESPTPSQPLVPRAVAPGASEPPRPPEPSPPTGARPLPRAPQAARGGETLPSARQAPPEPATATADARGDAASASETPEPEALAAAPPARPAPARDFVRRAELPDGTVLELGGIAYSASAPFAYLNGKLLAAGESVAGYRVESITRDRVVLAAGGDRITLRLKAP